MHKTIVMMEFVYRTLKRQVDSEAPKEAFAVLGCGLSSSAKHCRLLARSIFIPAEKDYAEQTGASVCVQPEWIRSVMRRCVKDQLHPVFVHSHPFTDHAGESGMDRDAAKTMCPGAVEAMPGAAIGTMVVSRSLESLDAHFYNVATSIREPVDIVYVPRLGDLKAIIPTSSTLQDGYDDIDDVFWSRLKMAFGPELVRLTRHVHVGVVGAGGLGEPIAIQLANLGFKLTLLDSDQFGEENENRSWMGNHQHVEQGLSKVDVCAAALSQSNPETEVQTIVGDIRHKATQQALAACDILILATDNQASRVVASNLAVTHGLVMFDVGTGIDVDNGRLKSVRGQVLRIIPGLNLCHQCAGLLDMAQAGRELLCEEDYEKERSRGYVQGADVFAPQVMPVNTFLAGACVWDVMRYVSGASPESPADMVTYDLLAGTSRPHRYERTKDGQRTSCAACSIGGQMMRGDAAPFMTCDHSPVSEGFKGVLPEKG